MASLLDLPPSIFLPDNNAQLVAGDVGAKPITINDALHYIFDDTAEMAIVTPWIRMPSQYGGGTLSGLLKLFTSTDNTNNAVFDIFIMAVTPNSNNIDLETATSWDAANSSGAISLSAVTAAGDPIEDTVTLTNKDSVVAGDWMRIGVRCDADHASSSLVGNIYFAGLELNA